VGASAVDAGPGLGVPAACDGGPAQPPGPDRHPTVTDAPNSASALRSARPWRLGTPRRSAPALALAPAPAAPALTSLDRQRARKLVTAAEAVRKFSLEGLDLANGNGRGALAREAIEDHQQGSEACQLEAFEQALVLATERASLAFYAQEGWIDAVRAGLRALLEFCDEEPDLARYVVVHSAQASGAVLERRREVITRIAELLDDERAPARGYPPPLTAHAVANGVLGVLGERLSQSNPGPLVGLTAPLMSFTVLPFLGVSAARRELARPRVGGPAPDDGAVLDPLKVPGGRMNSRAVSALKVIGAEAGLTSKEVSSRTGVNDDAQSSRLLARLERLGLIENTRNRGSRAHRKAWNLTAAGQKVQDAIEREANAPEPISAFDLPKQYAGRVDDRAVLMLRVIGDQPWLRTSEVAERAGVEDEAQPARLLESLVDRGLAVSERAPHQKGTPKVWRLTPAGEALDSAIPRDTPAPSRSVALHLMHHSGGRLNDNATAVLRVIGAEPGVSNNDIAGRVGITDENTMSQQLARLAKRELVKNARTGGKFNVWHLTPAGEKLERAIWSETPPAEQHRLALDLVRDRGGRLNHRVVAVLRAIGAEPELSNKEIAERVSIKDKGTASELLTRLARFGLITNLVLDPLPFEPNAWRLTATGVELEAAVTDDRTKA
jgi:DNA-binding MarR family transcriptional regulator